MQLTLDLFLPSLFTLLTAPVASGKTKLIVEFYRQENLKVIYISPLRALANEVFGKLKKDGEKNVYLAGNDTPLVDCYQNFLKARKSFLVVTMELLNEDFLEEIYVSEEKVLFVIDEFHLFYYWGETFRPILHDRFLALLIFDFPVLAITATMDETVMSR